MEENFKNKLGFCFFVILVLFLGVGGYFFTKSILNDFDKEKNNNEIEIVSYKIDEKKDYIYYKNEEVISESAEIYYKDVVINLNTQEVLNESLEKENAIYKNNIQYISDINLISSEIINYNNDDLYTLNFREYKSYEFENYVSLVINDYNYTCFDLTTFYKTKSYVFDTKTGQQLTEKEILNKYNQSMDSIKEK